MSHLLETVPKDLFPIVRNKFFDSPNIWIGLDFWSSDNFGDGEYMAFSEGNSNLNCFNF